MPEHALLEAKIREAETRLRRIFDAVYDGIIVADPATRKVVQVNKTFCEMTGYTQQELVGLDVASIHPPEQVATIMAEFERCSLVKERMVPGIPVKRKDGSVFHADIGHATIFFDDRPHSVGIFRDISPHRTMLANLEQKTAEQEAILDGITAGIVLVKDRRLVWVNRGFEQMFGYGWSEAQGLSTEVLYPTRASFEQLGPEADPRLAAGETFYAERQMRRRDGSLFKCSFTGKMVDCSDITKGSIWILIDLTDRNELAKERVLEQERLQKVTDLSMNDFKTFEDFLESALIAASSMLASPVGFIAEYDETSAQMRIIAFTSHVTETCRVEEKHDSFPLATAGFLGETMRRRAPVLVNDFTAPDSRKRGFPDGHIGIARFLAVPIISGGSVVAMAALANKEEDYSPIEVRQFTLLMESLWEIGKRKRAEGELRRSQQDILQLNVELEAKIQERTAELLALSRRLIDVQEDERRHLARELHDEVGQALTGIKLGVENLLHGLPPSLKDEGRGIALSVGELLFLVRGLSLKLRPAILDDFGLLPALQRHFDGVAAKTGVRIAFQCAGTPMRSSRPIETALYRVAQEAVTNLVRHAGVEEAAVRLTFGAAEIHLEIEDHGVGFVLESWNLLQDSLGLSGMRERVTLLGGQFSLVTEPGHGTSITATLPRSAELSLPGREG